MQGCGFDELIVKGLATGAKGLYNLGKFGASKAIRWRMDINKLIIKPKIIKPKKKQNQKHMIGFVMPVKMEKITQIEVDINI